jgi:calcineurin-like phosphoesterase
MTLNVLAIGDIVGDAGVAYLSRRLPVLKRMKAVDFTVVNGENAAGTGLLPRRRRPFSPRAPTW